MKIDCKALADRIKAEVKEEVKNLPSAPRLLIIRVKGDDASEIYVRNKKRACEEVGIIMEERAYGGVTDDDLIMDIRYYQKEFDAVMVQLPLPSYISARNVINAIDPNKDVDGLTDVNIGRLWSGEDGLFPCTASGIIEILKSVTKLQGKDVIIVNRSNLVGKPLAGLLLRENATPTICHSRTRVLQQKMHNARIVVTATGNAEQFNEYYVGWPQIIIDAGISRKDGKVVGDWESLDCFDDDERIEYTPVPGGVGLLTVAMLLKNVVKAYRILHG